jgi:hypothetical protein
MYINQGYEHRALFTMYTNRDYVHRFLGFPGSLGSRGTVVMLCMLCTNIHLHTRGVPGGRS